MISGLGIRRYLRRVPIDAIKIDSSFIDRLERYNEDLMIVRSIITLAHALDLGVVAMGVERLEQLVELKRLGCDQAQGYVISPAVDASTAAGMVGTGWQASTS